MGDFTQNIPPEILTDIFKWLHLLAINECSGPVFVDHPSVYTLCWPVSHVSRYWREVALAAPFLWTSLPLVILDDDRAPSPQARLNCMETLVPRCGGNPLHISFDHDMEGDFHETQAVHSYLVGHSEQWKSLSITASCRYVNLLLEDVAGRIQNLEEVEIGFIPDDCHEQEIDSLRVAPKLRSLRVSGDPESDLWTLWVDTTALTYLCDETGTLMGSILPCFDTVAFPMLTTLELHETGGMEYEIYEDFTDESEAVTFPVLKTLRYYCPQISAEEGLLKFISTPALEDLFVDAPDGDILCLLKELCERTGRLPLKALRLIIDKDYSCEDDFADLLEVLPDVETLDINGFSIDNISCLAISQGAEVLGPRLKRCSFAFHGDNFTNIHKDLTQVASTRCEPSFHRTMTRNDNEVAFMDLSLYSTIYLDRRTTPGFGHETYQFLGMQPTRLEPWYGQRYPRQPWESADLPRSPYTEAEATIPHCLLQGLNRIDKTTFDYTHSIDLLTAVEERYKNSDQLVDFLETNTNCCMISFAYILKTQLPEDSKQENSPYKRVVRLLKQVKSDLMKRLDDFHWIWETTTTEFRIRYIRDGHEMRADRDRFANAVLGLSDDQWLLDEF